jgi:tetraacyldisaccharide-1-P 4'-kinase
MDGDDQGTRVLDYSARSVQRPAEASWGGRIERNLGRLLDRSVVRRLATPEGAAVVAIGGSTFGGSGKTPLAIECAAELARAGGRPVLVGHAYRADPGRPRLVSPTDRLCEVGDEALLAARVLEPLGARVVVAPSRAAAMAFAAQAADVLVLDGIAQLARVPATLAVLAVDAMDPWGGAPALPPRGMLRAPVGSLVAACDAIVPMVDAGEYGGGAVVDAPGGSEGHASDDHEGRPALRAIEAVRRHMWPARVHSRGAWADGGGLLTWKAMRSARVGLLVALGRPDRVLRWLSRRGVVPRAIVRTRDHGPFRGPARLATRLASARVDVWLATPKCALHAARGLPGVPIAVLDHSVALHPELRNQLRALVHS